MELWYTELHTKGSGICFKVKETLFKKHSKFQEVTVLDTEDYGRMLVIDGLVMLTERDEFIYHEMMAHPAFFLHRSPENVLVIGGGDGGTVREVARHKAVQSITLCEIDDVVLDVAKKFFPNLSTQLFSDNRVEIVVDDASKHIKDKKENYDVILVDSSDPVGPAENLFKRDFFESLKKSLKPDGIVVLQSESPFYHLDIIKNVRGNLLGAGFDNVLFYWAHIPTYPGGVWCWAIASCTYHPIKDFSLEGKDFNMDLKYYSPEIHKASFILPEYFKRALSELLSFEY